MMYQQTRSVGPVAKLRMVIDTGIPVTDALELAEDKSFWRHIVTAGCYG